MTELRQQLIDLQEMFAIISAAEKSYLMRLHEATLRERDQELRIRENERTIARLRRRLKIRSRQQK